MHNISSNHIGLFITRWKVYFCCVSQKVSQVKLLAQSTSTQMVWMEPCQTLSLLTGPHMCESIPNAWFLTLFLNMSFFPFIVGKAK